MNDTPDSTPVETIPTDLIRPGQAAKLLGVHLATVYRLMDNGRLPYYVIGRRQRRISAADVRALVRRGKPKCPRPDVAPVPSVAEVEARNKRTMSVLERLGLARYLPEAKGRAEPLARPGAAGK